MTKITRSELRESPWLTQVTGPDQVFGWYGYGGYAWLCAEELARYFQLPNGKAIKIILSERPVRGAIKVCSDGAYIRTSVGKFEIHMELSDFLETGKRYWGWLEYEDSAMRSTP